MGRKPFKSADEKLAIVLSVLKGETTQVEIARRLQMSQTTIAKWQKQFLDGGRESLARGDNAVTLASRRQRHPGSLVRSTFLTPGPKGPGVLLLGSPR